MDGLEQRGRERDGGSEKEPERARVIEREGGGGKARSLVQVQ